MSQEPNGLTVIRDFEARDKDVINEITRLAWKQYHDFVPFMTELGDMSDLAANCEIIVAEIDTKIVGVVGYVAPNRPRQPVFDPTWAVVRMLSTHPDARGRGVGRDLTAECVRRARRDGAFILALTTTKLNEAALKMYSKIGFRYHAEAPPVAAVPAGLYLMNV